MTSILKIVSGYSNGICENANKNLPSYSAFNPMALSRNNLLFSSISLPIVTTLLDLNIQCEPKHKAKSIQITNLYKPIGRIRPADVL